MNARVGQQAAALTLLGNALGLGRDLVLAALFGAGAATDAFLAAWTLPETTSPLLMDGLMVLVGVPFLTRAVMDGTARAAVAQTFWPVMAGLVVIAATTAALAPAVVTVLVPGIADPELAASCVRLASPTIPLIGAAGYLAATLRAIDRPVLPSAVFAAYNIGIIVSILVLHRAWGIRSAAVGLSVGALCMCAVLTPTVVRHVGVPGLARSPRRLWVAALAVGMPLLAYLLARQGQTYVERFVASGLEPGSIAQLNFAQKIGQVPGTVAIVVAVTGFAAMVRSVRSQRTRASHEVGRVVRAALAIALPATALVVAMAPALVALILQRGSFDATDTAATAGALRVYVLGLPAQVLVTVLVLACSALRLSVWLPVSAAGACVVVTAATAGILAPRFGVSGVAAADAVGIWVAAAILALKVADVTGPSAVGLDRRSARIFAVAVTTGAVAAVANVGADRLAAALTVVVVLVAGTLAGLVAARVLGSHEVLDLVPGGRHVGSDHRSDPEAGGDR